MASIEQELENRLFLITGGTSGVGKAIATGLARLGAKVVIVSRSASSGERALADLTIATGNDRAEYLVADLSKQSEITRLTEEFKQRYSKLHALLNIAGAYIPEKQITEDGIDLSFAINYLAHFMLTNQLLDVLKESAPSRVITVAGAPRFLGSPALDFEDIQFSRHYRGFQAFSEAMFARVRFSFELARRLEGSGVNSIAFHPGLIKSNLVQGAPLWLRLITAFMQPFAKDDCEIGVYLAAAQAAEKLTGVLVDNDQQIVPINEKYGPALGKKLWLISEKLVGFPST